VNKKYHSCTKTSTQQLLLISKVKLVDISANISNGKEAQCTDWQTLGQEGAAVMVRTINWKVAITTGQSLCPVGHWKTV
jgi:hypothetical protein